MFLLHRKTGKRCVHISCLGPAYCERSELQTYDRYEESFIIQSRLLVRQITEAGGLGHHINNLVSSLWWQVPEGLSYSLITLLLVFEGRLGVEERGRPLPQDHLHTTLLLLNGLAVGRQEGEVHVGGELEKVLDVLTTVRRTRLCSRQILKLLEPGPGGRVLRPQDPGVELSGEVNRNSLLLIWSSVYHQLTPLAVESKVCRCWGFSEKEECSGLCVSLQSTGQLME